MGERAAVTSDFRHSPARSVLSLRAAPAVDWTREPAVCGYRRLTYHNGRLKRDIPVPVSATPAVVSGVGVVVASDDGYVRFLDQSLAKEFWQHRLDSSVYASLVVDPARRHVIVAATSGVVVCFDLRGTLMWRTDLATPVYATPAVMVRRGLLAVAAFRSRYFALDLATGAVKVDRPVPEPWHLKRGSVAAYRDPYASPAVTDEDTVIVCCAEHVLCLAPDGTDLWQREVGHAIKVSPAVLHDRGEVAVLPADGVCRFLDIVTGQEHGSLRLGAKITASPAVSGDILAIGAQDGRVFGLDVNTRRLAWTSSQGAPRSYTSMTVLPDGSFIATAERGNVIRLDRTDGAFGWESSQVLGLVDHEPAMDITPVAAPDGTMYCASYGGDLYQFAFRDSNEEP
jgi:outer membrane protein assembly factor BamB